MAKVSIKPAEDWVEEEILVYVDYDKYVQGSEITDPDMQFKIIGLDKSTVYSEINGKVFSGTYADALGTNLFFAEDPDRTKSENIFEHTPAQYYKLVEVADKVIPMKRIFVEPTTNPEEEEEAKAEGSTSEGVRRKFTVERSYQEALDRLLKPGQLPPRTVTDVLDNKILLQREFDMTADI